MKRTMSIRWLELFERKLRSEDRSDSTVSKYMHDVRVFCDHVSGKRLTRKEVLGYREWLVTRYTVRSANSMIAALNSFLRCISKPELCVRSYRVQRDAYSPESKELSRDEYVRLVERARGDGNDRLELVMQTICGCGLRVSELSCITVESVRRGEAYVCCKGKTRRIFIVDGLRRRLLRYATSHGIRSGQIFVTRTGRPMSRHNVWREMKHVSILADVTSTKVFPHNLRHLFARTFYEKQRDIVRLADILGHSSVDTTRIYVMTSGVEHRRQMEQMRLII